MMPTLNFNDFNTESRNGWAEFIAAVRAGVKSPDRCSLIRHFGRGETNDLLINLAESLIRIYQEPNYPEHPLEDGLVFRVEPCEKGVRDTRGVVLYSTTTSRFPCHTDGSGKREPYDVLILHCIRPSVGGDSILLTLDEICSHIRPSVLETLKEPVFPVPFGRAPILWEEGWKLCIRYNFEELSYYSALRNVVFSETQKEALRDLEATIVNLEKAIPKFHLRAGDCLVIDNKRVLHGRTALEEGSNRLLKRLRGYWASPNDSVA